MYRINNYTPDEIKRMQKRAVERVRRMQNMAQQTVKGSNLQLPSDRENFSYDKIEKKQDGSINNSEKTEKSSDGTTLQKAYQNQFGQLGINDLLNSLMKDREKTLLISLVLLLISDNENPAIIFALIYILL